jgi:predicted phage terminase large subunit-like protein
VVDAALLKRAVGRQATFLGWQDAWRCTARRLQVPEEAAVLQGKDPDFTECGYLAGRGFGKTRVGAEWMARKVFLDPTGHPSAVIAPTYQDVKFTCFEGESGLINVIPPKLIKAYNKSDMIIEMFNCVGEVAMIRGFTAEKPERLRGPQHARIWADELAAWPYDDVWDMAMMGLRLGDKPQALWTTTPKPKDLVRKLTTPKPGRLIVSGSTYDNRANLPDSFFDQLQQYEGTMLGRQELYGELIDPEESGIVKRSQFRLWPHDKPLPQFDLVILSLDTAFTEKTLDKRSGDPDPTACTVWGVFHHEKRNNIMLLDCWEDHLGMPALIRRVKKEMNIPYGDDGDTALIKPMFGSAKPYTSGRKPDILLIEDKGSGISLRQMLEAEGIETYPYNPGNADKLTRLHIVSPIFARRMVWLPESAKNPGKPRNWIDPLLHQLCSFTGPKSVKHDDFVDSTTQALRLCMDKRLLDAVQARKDETGPPPKVVTNPYAA